MSQGLKPASAATVNVRAKARTYLRDIEFEKEGA
jgi:hypothetical protein